MSLTQTKVKFRCSSISGTPGNQTARFEAVPGGDSGEHSLWQGDPSGRMEYTITNPDVDNLTEGKEITATLDFS